MVTAPARIWQTTHPTDQLETLFWVVSRAASAATCLARAARMPPQWTSRVRI